MTSPGGVERGRVSVRVLPDTSRFSKELSAYLKRVETTLKVELPTVLDTSGIAGEARRAAKLAEEAARVKLPTELEDQKAEAQFVALRERLQGHPVTLPVHLDVDRARSQIQDLSTRVLKLGGQLSVLGLGALGGQAAAGGVLALGGALSQVAGALALYPAAGAAAASALATVTVGFQGVGEALKHMDDPEKFAKALEKLSPAARETVLAIKSLGPAAEDLRKSVQDALFDEMAGTVQKLAKSYLPALKSGLTGVAHEINAGAQGFARFLESSQSMKDTGTIFENIQIAFHALVPAGTAFAQALRDITTVGSGFLPGLAQGFTQVSQRFADFIAHARETGQLNDFIANALHTIGQLADILGNVGRIFGAVFKAGADSGNSLLGIIGDVTDTFADFLNSLQGQMALQTFFDSAAQAAHALMPVLGGLVQVIAAMAPVLADIGTAVAPAFGRALNAIAAGIQKAQPGIVAFAAGFADFIDAITPAIPAVADLANTLGTVLGDAMRTLGPAVGTVIKSLATAIQAAAPGITAFANGFASFLTALAPALPAIGELARVLGEVLGDALTKLGPVISKVATVFANVLAEVLPEIVPPLVEIAEVFGDLLVQLAPIIPPLAQLASKILTAFARILEKIGPPLADFITKLVDDLAPYIGPLVDAFLDLFDAVEPLIEPMLRLVTAVMEPLLPLLGPITALLSLMAKILGPIATLLGGVLDIIGKLITGLGNLVGGLIDFATDAYYGVLGLITGTDQSVHTSIQKMNGYWDQHGKFVKGIVNPLVDEVVSGILGIPTRSQKAWTDLKNQAQGTFGGVSSAAAQAMASVLVWTRRALGQDVPTSLGQVGSAAQAAFGSMPGAAKRGVDGAVAETGRLPSRAQAALGNMEKALTGSGTALTKGFANGMITPQALAAVARAAGRVVQTARDYFPSSPAKKGAFSGKGWTPYSGRATAEGFSQGLIDRLAVVKNAAAQLMDAAAGQIGVDGAAVSTAGAGGHTFHLYQAPGQSTESMAAAIDRRLGFAGRFS